MRRGGALTGFASASVEFDMPAVVERKNRIVGTLTKGVEGMLKRAGVETIAGHARLVSRSAVEVGREALRGANILIATGSRPAVPPIPGIRLGGRARFEHRLCPDARPGENRHHRRRLHRPGVRLLLQRDRRAGDVYEMLPQIAAGCDREIASRLLAGPEAQRASSSTSRAEGPGDRGRHVALRGRRRLARPALRPTAS